MADRMRVTALMKSDYSRQPGGQLDRTRKWGLPGPFPRGGPSTTLRRRAWTTSTSPSFRGCLCEWRFAPGFTSGCCALRSAPPNAIRLARLRASGRGGGGVAPAASHRAGRAQLRHPARPVADSHALRYPWSSRGQRIEVRCPRAVARPRPRDEAPPSLPRVLAARVPRSSGTTERSESRPSLRSHFVAFARRLPPRAPVFVAPHKPDAGLGPGVFGSGHPQELSLARRRRSGVPSSWGTSKPPLAARHPQGTGHILYSDVLRALAR